MEEYHPMIDDMRPPSTPSPGPVDFDGDGADNDRFDGRGTKVGEYVGATTSIYRSPRDPEAYIKTG